MEVGELWTPAGDDAVVINVHVQPGAGRTVVVGRHGSALKLRMAAPPEGGRADAAVAALLTETFGAGGAELVGGAGSRAKRFKLIGLDLEEFRRRLERVVEEGAAAPGRGSQGHR